MCVLVAVALVAAGRLMRSSPASAASAAPSRLLCGAERWSVKSFADADRATVDLTPRPRTIGQLNALARPATRPANGRAPAERRTYRVVATVTASIAEADGDVHLVLTGDDGSTMIAEAPAPGCTRGARDRAAIGRARLAAQGVRLGRRVVAAGVGFFDFAHHQTGHARNSFELHPLLSLRGIPTTPS